MKPRKSPLPARRARPRRTAITRSRKPIAKRGKGKARKWHNEIVEADLRPWNANRGAR